MKCSIYFCCLMILCAQAVFAENLVILFTHDLHSNLQPFGKIGDNGGVERVGGYARIASAINREKREKEENCLVVDAGDFLMGSLFHTIFPTDSSELITMGAMG